MPPDRTGPGQSHAQIADHNSRTILEALRRNGPMTRMELAALTGLTTVGITNVIKRHMAQGLIGDGGRRRTPNAQIPSAAYALRPEGAFSIGIRIRPDRVEGVLVDISGTIHSREIGSDMAAVVETLTAIRPSANIIGIGVASAGELKPDLVEALAPVPVVGELDTVAAAICERTFGAEIPKNGLVIVLLEEFIRSCLLLHSLPFAGVRGRAGRVGEMHTGSDRQNLDAVCSSRSFAAVDGTDEIARWVSIAAEHLLDALTAITGFVAPGKIVLAGELPVEIMEALIGAMQQRWTSQTPESPPPALPPVSLAAYPHDSVLLGAAFLPFFELLLPKPSVM